MVRRVETDDACLIFDDTIQEKNWMDENDIICWHFSTGMSNAARGLVSRFFRPWKQSSRN